MGLQPRCFDSVNCSFCCRQRHRRCPFCRWGNWDSHARVAHTYCSNWWEIENKNQALPIQTSFCHAIWAQMPEVYCFLNILFLFLLWFLLHLFLLSVMFELCCCLLICFPADAFFFLKRGWYLVREANWIVETLISVSFVVVEIMHGLWKKLSRAFHLSLHFYSWSCKNGGVEFPFQGEPWLWIDFKHLHTLVFFELMFDRDQEGTTLFQSNRCDMALMNNCRKFSFWSAWGPLSTGQGGRWRCVWGSTLMPR